MSVVSRVEVEGKKMVMSSEDQGEFEVRHIGPSVEEQSLMLSELGYDSIDNFIGDVVPDAIRRKVAFQLKGGFDQPLTEEGAIGKISEIAKENTVSRSLIGMGYYDTITPAVILRNILENPGWYTQYTPYQPEISQGRLEALLNYQTMVSDLTGLPVSNSSLLDEGTAAAEAMFLSAAIVTKKRREADTFLVEEGCHPQTIAVVKTRAEALGYKVKVSSRDSLQFSEKAFGLLLQYPDTEGAILDPSEVISAAKEHGILVTVATDLLALNLIKSPGELGADIAVGNSQRFGVPMGYGGPHAAFFSVREEYKRLLPGRLVGVSKDRSGRPALRLALQTREQHIRREKATSNICTAQVLLAIMAGMYGVYHGPKGLRRLAEKVSGLTGLLASLLEKNGAKIANDSYFDTLTVEVKSQEEIRKRSKEHGINLRYIGSDKVGVSLDERSTEQEVSLLASIITGVEVLSIGDSAIDGVPEALRREGQILTDEVFTSYHSETEFLRYVRRLESKDLSLGTAMIPLGSCTMKLNATSEMIPVTWPEFASLHPFVPAEQARGYHRLFNNLESMLSDITGLPAVSLQPNAGSQGEYAGLLVIRAYHQAKGDTDRNICLIPKSAHGTNPASAALAGFKVVPIECDQDGNIDIDNLRSKAEEHKDKLAALMVTYPSTHGVFEEGIKEICEVVHSSGGQVYMDGANLNALVGLSSVGELGADVVHINLHKTFCIPHGGGGPGMGPIAAADHLAPFLPDHPVIELGHEKGIGPVSAAPWGSSAILPISWMYIAMMGTDGLKRATEVAILNANYVASRLEPYYPVLYKGGKGRVAHECILDLRSLKESAGVEVEDVAKRLMDYGFHAPTISWPVPGTMMIEPTESESKKELDRFCDSMIAIRKEITEIEEGKVSREDNLLKNSPHTGLEVTSDEWSHPYSRKEAAYPDSWSEAYKFWPAVGRIDGVYGDRNLICTCAGFDE